MSEQEVQKQVRVATSLSRALEIIGESWTMLILKEGFNGTRQFGEFQKNLNIPKQTLAERLTYLCENELLYKRPISAKKTSLQYAMTAKALDLYNVMYSVWLWHEAHRAQIDVLPFDLIHTSCGKVLGATFRCRHCRQPATPDSVTFQPSDPPQEAHESRLKRRKGAAVTAGKSSSDKGAIAASLVGDAPSNEILFHLLRQPLNLQNLSRQTGLNANVLRERIERLEALDLIDSTQVGRRIEYAAKERANGFFPLLISLAEWGDRWCNHANPPPEMRLHSCQELLNANYFCDHCDGRIEPRNIRVQPRSASICQA